MRGVDVSDNQDAVLPWPAWYASGWRVAVLRKSIGFRDDAHFGRYVAESYAAGFIAGAYHAILGHQYYDPVRQAGDFLEMMPAQVSFIVLDDEAPGVSADDVVSWVGHVVTHSRLPLTLYGNWNLAAHIAARPVLKNYGVWWAGYPTSPLPTTTPPYAAPRNVPPGLRVVGWQFAGDNGRLPPYAGAIDLSVWYEPPANVPPVVLPMPAETGWSAAELATIARVARVVRTEADNLAELGI